MTDTTFVLTSGKLELYLAWHRKKRPFHRQALQEQLIAKLNDIEGLSLPANPMQRQPKILLSNFTEPARLAKLLAVYEWVIEQVQSNER